MRAVALILAVLATETVATSQDSRFYRFQNVASGLCLAQNVHPVENSSELGLTAAAAKQNNKFTLNQAWFLVPWTDVSRSHLDFFIYNAESGLVLEARPAKKQSEACPNCDCRAEQGTSKPLDESKTTLLVSTPNSSRFQQWHFVEVEQSRFKILNEESGLVLTASGESITLSQWDRSNSQLWVLNGIEELR